MNLKIKNRLFCLIALAFTACISDSNIEVYEKKGSKVFEKYIFEMGDAYFFANFQDSSRISVIGRNKILVNDDILFKRLNDLSARVNGPFSMEASNHESGNADDLNYDLRFKDNKLFVRLFHPDQTTTNYHINPDQEYVDLLKKAVNNFAQKRGNHHLTSKTENTVTLSIRLNGRNFRRSKSIHDDDVLLLYGAIRFMLTQNLKDKSDYIVIPDTLKVQTSEKYNGIRNSRGFIN